MSREGSYPTSRADWESRRDDIIRLYLTEDRPLREVRRILENEFHFKATLKQWGAMKNYKAREKDTLVEQVREALANGQDLGQMVFRGHSVKHHRVLRHWRAKAREGGSDTPFISMQVDETPRNHQLGALANRIVGPPPRPLGETSPRELILLSTKTYIESFVAFCHVDCRIAPQIPPSQAGSNRESGMLLQALANQFWHDLETAVYLLKIGSTALGWNTFHNCWGTATDNILSQPSTLLLKVLTTLHPHGSLKRMPEVSRSVLQFIVDLIGIKLGKSHPLFHICRNIWHDNEGPMTAESTLKLISSLFKEHLGLHHHERFKADLALINRLSQNGDFVAAEAITRSLVRNSESSPHRAQQLPNALTKLAHILKNLGRYEEAIKIHQCVLYGLANDISEDLRIYTMEDIAELRRIQGDLFVESVFLKNALLSAQEFFGRNQAPTLHIWDKFKDRREGIERVALDREIPSGVIEDQVPQLVPHLAPSSSNANQFRSDELRRNSDSWSANQLTRAKAVSQFFSSAQQD
ncbi:hypothetical protein MRS44_009812 [Fusarium solani]|uniref:uncharacterized protein n=1 Tax=Fusarium solani TaxID=169388 RepID=UPI0032C3DEAE|nr:hypothetical protein MRS44_009812 [Fusarium solani]